MSQQKLAKSDITGIDPKQHVLNVVMTDGTKFQIITSYGKEGDSITLDVDPKNHPAWQTNMQNFVNANDERVKAFEEKFGKFKFVGNAKSDNKPEAKKSEKE